MYGSPLFLTRIPRTLPARALFKVEEPPPPQTTQSPAEVSKEGRRAQLETQKATECKVVTDATRDKCAALASSIEALQPATSPEQVLDAAFSRLSTDYGIRFSDPANSDEKTMEGVLIAALNFINPTTGEYSLEGKAVNEAAKKLKAGTNETETTAAKKQLAIALEPIFRRVFETYATLGAHKDTLPALIRAAGKDPNNLALSNAANIFNRRAIQEEVKKNPRPANKPGAAPSAPAAQPPAEAAAPAETTPTPTPPAAQAVESHLDPADKQRIISGIAFMTSVDTATLARVPESTLITIMREVDQLASTDPKAKEALEKAKRGESADGGNSEALKTFLKEKLFKPEGAKLRAALESIPSEKLRLTIQAGDIMHKGETLFASLKEKSKKGVEGALSWLTENAEALGAWFTGLMAYFGKFSNSGLATLFKPLLPESWKKEMDAAGAREKNIIDTGNRLIQHRLAEAIGANPAETKSIERSKQILSFLTAKKATAETILAQAHTAELMQPPLKLTAEEARAVQEHLTSTYAFSDLAPDAQKTPLDTLLTERIRPDAEAEVQTPTLPKLTTTPAAPAAPPPPAPAPTAAPPPPAPSPTPTK